MPLGNGPAALFVPGWSKKPFKGTPTNDQFEGGSLGSWWTPAGTPPTILFPASGADPTITMGAQRDRIMLSATYLPSGSYSVRLHLGSISDGGGMTGIAILDGSGNGVAYSPYNDGKTYMWNITGYAYASTGPNTGTEPILATDFWIEIARSTTTYKGRWTNDPLGVSGWSTYTTTITNAFTPTQLGVLRAYTSGGTITAILKDWQIV